MTRIPDDQIERLKTEVSLQRLAEGMGVTLKRQAPTGSGCAPSMMITNPAW